MKLAIQFAAAIVLVVWSSILLFNAIRDFKFSVSASGHNVRAIELGDSANAYIAENTIETNVSGNITGNVSITNKIAFNFTFKLLFTIVSISYFISLVSSLIAKWQ